jgi:ribonuclease P protein component
MGGTLEMLRSPRDFAALGSHGRGRAHPLVAIRARRNGLDRDRFGISTGRRVGPSVVRNRVRRRLREILRAWDHPGATRWDILVVARPASAGATFADLRTAVLRLLAQITTKEGPM